MTAVDRDAGPADDATWARRGVMQFHHAHAFRQTVVEALGREVPETLDLWQAAGAEAIEFEDYGGAVVRLGLRSRRETFERCLRTAALATPASPCATATSSGVLSAGRPGRGRRRGRRTRGGRPRGRRVGPRGTGDPRAARSAPASAAPCGQAYVDRVYRLKPGAEPGPMTNPIAWQADLDGYLSLVFRHEQGLFSVLVVRRSDDIGLRALRHPEAFEAAARAIPGLDVWTDPERAEPVTDVLAGGALLNVYRSQCDEDGDLVLPGLFFVGDSVATTTPVFGRGITTTLWQCEALLSLLDHDADDLAATGHAFDAWSADTMRPWVEDHIHMDAAHVDRWNGHDVDLDAPAPVRPDPDGRRGAARDHAARRRLPLDGSPAGVAAGGRADRARGVRRRLAPGVRPWADARRAGRDRGARRGAASAGLSRRLLQRRGRTGHRMVPGLRMPSGSRASLIRRVSAITSGPSCSGSAPRLGLADAVLAGDRAAERDRGRHHLDERRPRPRSESGSVGS